MADSIRATRRLNHRIEKDGLSGGENVLSPPLNLDSARNSGRPPPDAVVSEDQAKAQQRDHRRDNVRHVGNRFETHRSVLPEWNHSDRTGSKTCLIARLYRICRICSLVPFGCRICSGMAVLCS